MRVVQEAVIALEGMSDQFDDEVEKWLGPDSQKILARQGRNVALRVKEKEVEEMAKRLKTDPPSGLYVATLPPTKDDPFGMTITGKEFLEEAKRRSESLGLKLRLGTMPADFPVPDEVPSPRWRSK